MRFNGDDDRRVARALTPCGRTRREFLWEAGGGFVGTALTALLAGDGFFARSAAASETGISLDVAAGHQAASFPSQGESVHRPVHVWRG